MKTGDSVDPSNCPPKQLDKLNRLWEIGSVPKGEVTENNTVGPVNWRNFCNEDTFLHKV